MGQHRGRDRVPCREKKLWWSVHCGRGSRTGQQARVEDWLPASALMRSFTLSGLLTYGFGERGAYAGQARRHAKWDTRANCANHYTSSASEPYKCQKSDTTPAITLSRRVAPSHHTPVCTAAILCKAHLRPHYLAHKGSCHYSARGKDLAAARPGLRSSKNSSLRSSSCSCCRRCRVP